MFLKFRINCIISHSLIRILFEDARLTRVSHKKTGERNGQKNEDKKRNFEKKKIILLFYIKNKLKEK